MMQTVRRAAVAALFATACTIQAHELSPQECQEGSDFIRNAALSRDGGLSREEFMGRMHGDLELIRAFPADLRWFVQDDDDEKLLVRAAESVFDAPEDPQAHHDGFMSACFATIERWTQR